MVFVEGGSCNFIMGVGIFLIIRFQDRSFGCPKVERDIIGTPKVLYRDIARTFKGKFRLKFRIYRATQNKRKPIQGTL